MYSAACEPHANSFGAWLFKSWMRSSNSFGISRNAGVDCCVTPPQRDGRQTPYCFSSFMAQGILVKVLARSNSSRGEAALDSWFQAGNSDGHLGLTTGCKTNKPEPRRISAVRLEKPGPRSFWTSRFSTHHSVASACDRFRKGDFNEAERNVQKWSLSAKGLAFIRPDELQFGTDGGALPSTGARAKVELTPPAEP